MDCFGQDVCAVDLMASAQRLRHTEDEPDAAAARELDAILSADERGIRAAQPSSNLAPREQASCKKIFCECDCMGHIYTRRLCCQSRAHVVGRVCRSILEDEGDPGLPSHATTLQWKQLCGLCLKNTNLSRE
eukprot:scaffold180007_cov19-Tisochrysis_lutea.AAC.1